MLIALLLLTAPPPLTPAQQARVSPVVEVVRNEGDAVVAVTATHIVTQSVSLFDVFALPRETARQTIGSGSIIHPSGYVLTNAHVVALASELSIVLANGKELSAHVVAALPEDDVAVIKADVPKGMAPLPSVRLGRSDDVMVGETVVAIGAPVGLQHTVTAGIISAKDRELAPNDRVKFTGILQIDAAINPGNSGGPLFNVVGEQIGVNTAIRGDAQNVGFAISVDRVKALLPRLLAVEGRGRTRLGLRVSRESSERPGVVVDGVDKGSPAAAAGIGPGMVITDVAGTATPSLVETLIALLEQPSEKQFVVRAVLPEGTIDSFTVHIEELPPPDGRALARKHFGVDVADLDTATAARLGLRAGAGVVVKGVDAGTEAQRAGIGGGDLITRIGPYGIRKVADLAVLEGVRAGAGVPVRIVRIGKGRVLQTEIVLQAR